VTRVERLSRDTFRALGVRNYRLFFGAQLVSVSGTWMQSLAQAWLVLQLSGSGVALGLVTAAQFLPMLVLGPWAGVVADRVDKRRFLALTQAAAALLALTLGILTATGLVALWMVFVLAVGLGLVNAFDMPARQTFVFEMVGPDRLTNAVSLNSIVMNAGRLLGPALGGVLIATVGLAACFLLNAGSYLAPLIALAAMRTAELRRRPPTERRPGQLREGLRYVWGHDGLRVPLLLMAVIGTLAYEFQVSLPLLARFTFDAGAQGYGLLLAAMSLGAVVGGLAFATRATPSHVRLGVAGLVFGALILLASVMPTLAATAAVLPLVGAASIAFITLANATLQLTAAPEMRGRVIALYGVAFLGTTPVGGPIVGWVGEVAGPRAGLALGGVAALLATAVAWRSLQAQPPIALVTPSGAGGEPALRPAGRPRVDRLAAGRPQAPPVPPRSPAGAAGA
jgi:MFS family permease